MSEHINDGGPAFPKPDCATMHAQEGMSIRDYFAGKALAGYFAAPHTPHRCDCREVAAYCYQMAEAMLRARDARSEQTKP